uniref:Uncharacterized protein n=1 Tax=Arundo donax TaxID=35708 RepID=A0A0A8YX21_ARUDO
MPSLRPILLLAAVLLSSSATHCVAEDDTFLPPATSAPFPFCPTRPAGASTTPFPWSPPPPQQMTVYPQYPGFFPSGARHVRSRAVAWLPLASLLSAFFMLLQ